MNPERLWTTGVLNRPPVTEIYTAYDIEVRL